MSWTDRVGLALDRVVSILKDDVVDTNYIRKSDPDNPVPLRAVYSKMEKDMDIGSLEVGTYQDSPHALIKLSDLDFDPKTNDSLEVRGETLVIYKILKDGEGGATLHLGERRS